MTRPKLGSLLSNDLQSAAISLRPGLRRALAAGRELGALGAMVSGSGPTCAFLAKNRRHARDLAVALAGAGVCRTVVQVTGPVPGATHHGHADGAGVNLVNLEKVVKGYGQRLLLDGVSAGVAAGERVGVVGRNGAGKSTLLALLAGVEQPDSGRVTRARDLRIGHLAQQDRLAGTVGDLVTGGRPEHVWAGDPRTRSAVAALLPGIDFAAQAERLSGGESRRVALAALLLGDHDLLLLDEPTNHLDVEAVDWLARFLAGLGQGAGGGHPRPLVPGRGMRADLGDRRRAAARLRRGLRRLRAGQGGTGPDRRRRAAQAAEPAAQGAGLAAPGAARPDQQARFRIEAANALIADEPAPRDGVELVRLATARLGKTVVDVEDLTVRAAAERTVAVR